MYSGNFSMEGWNLWSFIKGRKKLVVAAVGYVGGWIITQNPATAGIVAAGTELVYAVLEYYIKKY